ncbi:unnamed protein product [Rhizophagus irregularis]|nr:unnamed protein product [Rhizophagus irregularis]
MEYGIRQDFGKLAKRALNNFKEEANSDKATSLCQTILKINYDLKVSELVFMKKSRKNHHQKISGKKRDTGKEKGKKDKESKGTKGRGRGRKGKGKVGKREGRERKILFTRYHQMMMVHDNSSEQHDGEDNERDEGVPAPGETIDSVLTIKSIIKNHSAILQVPRMTDDESSFVATVENIVFEGKAN